MLGFTINIPVHLSNALEDQAMPMRHSTHHTACRSCASDASGQAKAGALLSLFQNPAAAFISVSQRSHPSPVERETCSIVEEGEKPIISPPSTLHTASAVIYCESWRMFCSILHRCSLIAWGRERDTESRLLPFLFSC